MSGRGGTVVLAAMTVGVLTVERAGAQCDAEVIALRCEAQFDACAAGGPGHADGTVDPREAYTLSILFQNVGSGPARDFTAVVDPRAGAVLLGSPDLGPFTIQPGGFFTQEVQLEVVGACGSIVDVDLVDLLSDDGACAYPDVAACDVLIGRDPVANVVDYTDDAAFTVPDGGSARSPVGVDPTEPAPVPFVSLKVVGDFAPGTRAILHGPSGSTRVDGALGGSLDITDDYAGVLGGAGHHELEVQEVASDGADSRVLSWTLTVDSGTTATCTDCPVPGQPAIQVTCARVGDRCPDDPSLEGNGQDDFGELVDVEIVLGNFGTATAIDYTAVVEAVGADVIEPPGGRIAVPAIPVLGAETVVVTVSLPARAAGAACGDPVDLSLTGQSAEGPIPFPDDPLAACDFELGDGSGSSCSDCATAPLPCLYRAAFTSLEPLVPDRSAVYLVPRTAEDIALQGLPHACGIANPGVDLEAVLGNGVPLMLYQVDASGSLRLEKAGDTVRYRY